MTDIASPITAQPIASGEGVDVQEPTRRVAAWLTLSLIAALALICCGGVWWWLHREAAGAPDDAGPLTSVITDAPPGVPRGWRGGGRPGGPPGGRQNGGFFNRVLNRVASGTANGIESTGNGYIVHGTGTYMDVLPGRGNDRWQYRFFYTNQSLVTPDQQKLIRALMRTNDADAAAKAGVTAEQKAKLKKIPPGGMVVQPAQRTQIASLFTAWLTAAGRTSSTAGATTLPTNTAFPASAKPAQDALISALSSIAQQQVQASLQNAADRVKQIHDILGDAEIQKLQ